MNSMADVIYQFENFILDVKKQRLFRDGRAVNADLRTIELLTCLIQASPDWVDKNELLECLWPDQEITDWALSRLISDTRKMLGDDGGNQRIIQTIRGRGFQFYEDFKQLSSSEAPIEEINRDDPPVPTNNPLLLRYLLGGLLFLIALLIGMNYLPDSPTEKHDVTALINLSGSEKSQLNDILEDWALSQDDLILLKDNNTDTRGGDLFKHYCGRDECNQLILITIRKNGKGAAYRYQVMSDGVKEEERELISSNQVFLISALRDAVASTMNRSSDYFPLPLSILMQHPNQVFQDMYQIHINLENTYVTFVAQARRRNELVKLITKRLNITRKQQYEKFFITYFDQMNKQERFIFDQIRAMTSGTLYQGNRNMLTLLESNPTLVKEIPKLDDVRKHLAFWVNKYYQIFLTRDDMCLLYVGVEDGVPFPSGIDQDVSGWLAAHDKKQ